MSGTASDPFFWNDLLAEPTLRACTRQARSFWMDCLCVMAQPIKQRDKGYLLLNGKKPSNATLAKMFGDTPEEVENWMVELTAAGVCSTTRRGVVYSRRMVREEIIRKKCSKGGKITGRANVEKKRGIFKSMDGSMEGGMDVSMTPSHPIPISKKKKVSSSFSKSVGKSGVGSTGLGSAKVTINDPKERVIRFQKWLADKIGATGWTVIAAACDPTSADFQRCIDVCKQTARENGKGWPHEWPASLEWFETYVAGGVKIVTQ